MVQPHLNGEVIDCAPAKMNRVLAFAYASSAGADQPIAVFIHTNGVHTDDLIPNGCTVHVQEFLVYQQ